MSPKSDHISVCICTYKRPKFLAHLLGELQKQLTDDLFTYSVVVVDNDHDQSSESTVALFKDKNTMVINYYVEPEQNIALARNRAVANANGDLVAFIDDDEFPESTWLLNLYKSSKRFTADGILGPVKPHFAEKPPNWLIKGKICELPTHNTGTVLRAKQTRTGNVLFNRSIFEDKSHRFNPEFGRTGGEDIEFFRRMTRKGRVFVWCNEATVYETVPPERWTKSYYLERNLRIGGLAGEYMRKMPHWGNKHLIKFIIAFILYTALLPFSFLLGTHMYMKCLIKFVYHFGWLTGFCGVVFIRLKNA